MRMQTLSRSILGVAAAAFIAVGTASLAGCHHEGPAERAGKKIDKAADDVGDAVDDATH